MFKDKKEFYLTMYMSSIPKQSGHLKIVFKSVITMLQYVKSGFI